MTHDIDAEQRVSKFTDIFINKKWDREPNEDKFSGMGSRPENTAEYEQLVLETILENDIRTVVDIGCGDFQVARRWLPLAPDIYYTGCDIVPDIVEAHNRRHATDRITFRNLDAVVDEIPQAGLILVREVLQHNTNAAISAIMPKLIAAARIILATECVRRKPEAYNVDIVSGRQTRVGKMSGVFLEKEPFNVQGEVVLKRRHAFSSKKSLRTMLIHGRGTAR